MTRKKQFLKLKGIKTYHKSLFKLSFARNNIDFIPGQHISLGIPGIGSREYSVASGNRDKFLDVLIRKIPNGKISVSLLSLNIGDIVEVGSPVGFFRIPEKIIGNPEKKIYLIATGSGIAPFISFSRSYPDNRFVLLHGISDEMDNMKAEILQNTEYLICSTKTEHPDYYGRVTAYLQNEINYATDALFFLCGNGEMIYETYRILSEKKANKGCIFYEEYF